MQVTLRQAHKLVDKLTARIAITELTPVKSVNVFEVSSGTATIEALREEFKNTLTVHLNLIAARQFLRDMIQAANGASGINALIQKRKGVTDIIGTYRHVLANAAGSRGLTTGGALTDKAESMRAASKVSTGYGTTDEVQVSLIDSDEQAEYDRQVQSLQLTIETIEDELTTLNAGTKIGLSSEVEGLLTEEGLI